MSTGLIGGNVVDAAPPLHNTKALNFQGFLLPRPSSMDLNAVLQQLQTSLPDLSAVYVFGSYAKGQQTPDSDLDLAILIDGPEPDPVTLWQLAGELADTAGCPVDLVDLRAASTVFQYQIITTGQRLWTHGSQAALYESFILSEKTALDSARADLLADILKEGRIHAR